MIRLAKQRSIRVEGSISNHALITGNSITNNSEISHDRNNKEPVCLSKVIAINILICCLGRKAQAKRTKLQLKVSIRIQTLVEVQIWISKLQKRNKHSLKTVFLQKQKRKGNIYTGLKKPNPDHDGTNCIHVGSIRWTSRSPLELSIPRPVPALPPPAAAIATAAGAGRLLHLPGGGVELRHQPVALPGPAVHQPPARGVLVFILLVLGVVHRPDRRRTALVLLAAADAELHQLVRRREVVRRELIPAARLPGGRRRQRRHDDERRGSRRRSRRRPGGLHLHRCRWLIAGEEKEGWNALSFDFFFSRFEKEKKWRRGRHENDRGRLRFIYIYAPS